MALPPKELAEHVAIIKHFHLIFMVSFIRIL